MGRIRVQAPDEIKSLVDAETALGEIGSLMNELDQIDAKGTKKIAEIKSKMASEGEKARERIKTLEANLALYAKYNKAELFKDKKTVILAYGSFGFRQSTSVRVKKTTTELLKKLFHGKGIRIKEEPDKEQLKDWSDEDLATVDAAKTVKDEFGYDINREEVNRRLLRQSA